MPKSYNITLWGDYLPNGIAKRITDIRHAQSVKAIKDAHIHNYAKHATRRNPRLSMTQAKVMARLLILIEESPVKISA